MLNKCGDPSGFDPFVLFSHTHRCRARQQAVYIKPID
jgi:hypothetical protein